MDVAQLPLPRAEGALASTTAQTEATYAGVLSGILRSEGATQPIMQSTGSTVNILESLVVDYIVYILLTKRRSW